MKHEIIKKTFIYRLLAYALGVVIAVFSPMSVMMSIYFATISEVSSWILYYIFELTWRKYVSDWNLKKGLNLFIAKNGTDRHGWYNVVEVLDDNKFVIEVV